MVGGVDPNTDILIKSVQSINASLIAVVFLLIISSVSLLHPLKAEFPILITEDGIVNKPTNPVQPKKTEEEIELIELDIFKLPLKPVQFSNALLPIDVTEFGMIRDPFNPVQLLKV
jgi:hypothetical protein